ncbi:phosphate ABC transporter permease subunit PstC [Saccharospirillum sp. MSK14-1]|uniref:phosphate ABC transporter permease subunit PstC n=1 Tax=Saccharospirillum sp. MSK14-1 TaxID=1897632 RepID=UPI000D38B2AB|nr:phosphate ABC transporter permease subunit PstC [Saccharospirillum sp. MSK14-1]PTY35687.1 phosphate ABC transporter permease subunit PstC [Saccharospirillum sp. MSK14-1]
MQTSTLLLVIAVLAVLAYGLGRQRSIQLVGGPSQIKHLHSLPNYYGLMAAAWAILPGFILLAVWVFLEERIIIQGLMNSLPDSYGQLGSPQMNLTLAKIQNISSGSLSASADPQLTAAAELLQQLRDRSQLFKVILTIGTTLVGALIGWVMTRPALRARPQFEFVLKSLLLLCSTIAIFTTVGIILSVLFESIRFFQAIPFFDFVFGLQWSPQIAIRADQVGSSGAFGAIPLFVGTLMIAAIALIVAVPIGLMSAVYLAEYAKPRVRNIIKPLLEVLAGIPTVVYGFFAALTMGPLVRDFFQGIGFDGVSAESALAAGLVMGIMIIPFVSSLSDDVINAVPNSLRDGSYGLGATRSETIRQVVFPAALPGIMGGILLAASRAIGETMIVVMAAGLAANLTANPLEAVTTVTVQIATLLVGDQEFDSPKTLSAFALGLMLFFTTLLLNIVAMAIVKRFREQYD